MDRRRMMMQSGGGGDIPYIKDGLVFWLDVDDYVESSAKWKERIAGLTFDLNPCRKNVGVVNPYAIGDIPFFTDFNNYTLHICYKESPTSSWTGTGIISPSNEDGLGLTSYAQNNHVHSTSSRPTYGAYDYGIGYDFITASFFQRMAVINKQIVMPKKYANFGVFTDGRFLIGFGRGLLSFEGEIATILYYNRELTIDEMNYNQQIDNERFHLGL